MINRRVNQLERPRRMLDGSIRAMITDSEELLKAAATQSGEGFSAARSKFEETVRRAKVALADVSQPVFDKTRKSAAVADDYVRGNPWTAVGVAVAVGALMGFLAAKR